MMINSNTQEFEEMMMGFEYEEQCLVDGELPDNLAKNGTIEGVIVTTHLKLDHLPVVPFFTSLSGNSSSTRHCSSYSNLIVISSNSLCLEHTGIVSYATTKFIRMHKPQNCTTHMINNMV
jgi:hypothetical protein